MYTSTTRAESSSLARTRGTLKRTKKKYQLNPTSGRLLAIRRYEEYLAKDARIKCVKLESLVLLKDIESLLNCPYSVDRAYVERIIRRLRNVCT